MSQRPITSFDGETEASGNIGKLIHVEGDLSSRFTHESAGLNSENVTDGANTGGIVRDNTATDVIEEWALYIAAPGPSLRSATSTNSRTRVFVAKLSDMVALVQALTENGILEAEALEEIDRAPRN